MKVTVDLEVTKRICIASYAYVRSVLQYTSESCDLRSGKLRITPFGRRMLASVAAIVDGEAEAAWAKVSDSRPAIASTSKTRSGRSSCLRLDAAWLHLANQVSYPGT
jgi:hypothetical protein